jgi:hypothetical protein
MSIAAGILAKLFENRYNFLAPDSGPHKLPYTCSFHWFHLPDGKLIGVDVVRSDDMGRRALRVFALPPGGDLASLLLEGPSSEWAPFATDNPPTMPQDKPVLGRGENWLAASATVSGQSINAVSFLLKFKVLVPGKGTGECGLVLAHMTAMDYLRMEISGWIELNGDRINLDRAIGYASVHFGDFLPNYAGVASVPPHNPAGPGILVNVTDSDDIKHGAALIGDQSAVYGYGSDPIPRFFLTVGKVEKGRIPLGGARLEWSDLKSCPHFLLERPTTTAVANATHVSDSGSRIPVGQVILDFRGVAYAPLIAS